MKGVLRVPETLMETGLRAGIQKSIFFTGDTKAYCSYHPTVESLPLVSEEVHDRLQMETGKPWTGGHDLFSILWLVSARVRTRLRLTALGPFRANLGLITS